MGQTLTEKILDRHLVSGRLIPGEEIALRVDQTLTQDATGTMVFLQYETMDIPRVRTELSVSYVDHNTMQADHRNMDDHLFLQSVAGKYGVYFSRPGNGICHQVHLERFGVPGKTLLGSDSHTPTGGGLGMIAIGAGGLDVAVAMAGGAFYLNAPEVVGIRLEGELQAMCSAKDVILKILQLESVKGGVGKVFEYFGPGVDTLSVPDRATITNMGAELGATTSIFPSDNRTREYLKTQNREECWAELKADEGASYSKVIDLDLATIPPLVACPHMPDLVVPVEEVAGKRVDQVVIGSCTNSSISDLGVASEILDGSVVAPGVSLGIVPGSRQVLESALELKIVPKLIASGARLLESACGPCIGMGFAPATDAVSLRTFNRNFNGRSGTKDSQVYLVSPETAAASALKGVITDPRTVPSGGKRDYSLDITVSDSMIIPPLPAEEATTVEVQRGPNIKPCPRSEALPGEITGEVLIKTGDNITTDHIMPASARLLPLRSNIPEISKHVFAALDPGFHQRALDAGGGVIVGGDNYGQGSSREHAAIAPMYLKIRVIVAKGFARIHRSNLINFGILPLVFENSGDYDKTDPGDRLKIVDPLTSIEDGVPVVVRNLTKELEFSARCSLSPRELEIVRTGGLLNLTRQQAV